MRCVGFATQLTIERGLDARASEAPLLAHCVNVALLGSFPPLLGVE